MATRKAQSTTKADAATTCREAGRIRLHLAAHGLRLGMDAGRRVLQKADAAGRWLSLSTPQAVRTWGAALAAALQLGLCGPLQSPLPEVTERNFEAAAHQIECPNGEVIKLADYQAVALRMTHRIEVWCWSRQTGKDFTASLAAVLDAIESGQNWYIVSLTQRQALATAKKAQTHAKAILGALMEMTENEEWINGVKLTSYGLRLPNGAEIVALPGKDPDALAGLTGNVIFTEMALFPDNGEKHWKVVFPLTTRGFRVICISTPRGPETKFSELRRNAQGLYRVLNVTIHDAVAGGMRLTDESGKACDPEYLRRLYNDEAGWSREYLCIEGDDHEPLIPWKTIHDCGINYEIPVVEIKGRVGIAVRDLVEQFDASQPDNLFAQVRSQLKGSPLLGWDVATSGDFSVVTYGERLAGVAVLRAMVVMHGVEDYDYQEGVVKAAMDTVAVGTGDASGIGRQTCQNMVKRYGEARFGALVFTTATKTPLFTQLRQEMQSGRVCYPAGLDILKYDIHALGRRGMGVGGTILRVETNRNTLDQRSHADMATSLALMVNAAQGDGGPTFAESAGRADRRGRAIASFARPDNEDDDFGTAANGWGY